jgi:hypothetical protein
MKMQRLNMPPVHKEYSSAGEVYREYDEYVKKNFRNKDIPEKVKSTTLWKIH